MKTALLIVLAMTISSCSNLENIIFPGRLAQEAEKTRLKQWEDGAEARAEASSRQKQKEIEENERDMAFIAKVSLPNTINLKVGMNKSEVGKLILAPSSVSAKGNEVTWHYDLYKYDIKNAPLVPFKVIFTNEKVSSFSIDQEKIERARASVVIQKDELVKD